MFLAILRWIFDSKAVKTTVASAVGSGAVVVGIIEAKMADVEKISERDKQILITYVDSKHLSAVNKIDVLIESQNEIKQTLIRIDDRLYNINKKLKE